MIFDNTLLFSDAQAITADANSTNIVDLGATGTPYGGNALVRDIGKGTKIPLFCYITETFNLLTTLDVILQVATDAAFTTPVEVARKQYALAALVAGTDLDFPDYIPQGANLRYIRLRYDVTGTNPSTGIITAGIVAARQSNMGDHY